jgi:hypothetical protein
VVKKKSVTEEDFDWDEPIDEIGTNQFWVASRATKNLLQTARTRLEAKRAAEKKAGWGFEEAEEEEQVIE